MVGKVGGGSGCRIGDIGTSPTSPVNVGVSSRDAGWAAPRVGVADISASSGVGAGLPTGKLPGIDEVIRFDFFLLSARLLAASLRWAALAGSDRPSVNQLGFGRLNREDLSEAESSAGMNLLEDLVGFGFSVVVLSLGGIKTV
jgi:hypothetical protein